MLSVYAYDTLAAGTDEFMKITDKIRNTGVKTQRICFIAVPRSND